MSHINACYRMLLHIDGDFMEFLELCQCSQLESAWLALQLQTGWGKKGSQGLLQTDVPNMHGQNAWRWRHTFEKQRL